MRSTRSVGVRLLVTVFLAWVCLWTSPPPTHADPDDEKVPTLIFYDDCVDRECLEAWLPQLEVVEGYESFLLANLTPEQKQLLEYEDVQVQDMTYLSQVSLPGLAFDTREGEPELPAPMKNQDTGDGWYLVQFVGPVKEAWREDLGQIGEIAAYLPQCTYVAYLTEENRAAVAGWTNVRWVGPYHPGYRVPADLDGTAFTIRLFPGHETEGLAALTAAGLTVNGVTEGSADVEGTVTQVQTAVAQDSVMAVTASHGPTSFVTTARGTLNADVVNARGLVGRPSGGTRQIIAIFDQGMYRGHEVFSEAGKVVGVIDPLNDYYADCGEGSWLGHGTSVASIAAGDAPDPAANNGFGTYNMYDGLALGCGLVVGKMQGNDISQFASASSIKTHLGTAYGYGARISNFSWEASSGEMPRSVDAECWEHRDHVVAAAAGNSGNPSGPITFDPRLFNTLNEVGLSKNAITVGNCRAETPEVMSPDSSCGPASLEPFPEGNAGPVLTKWGRIKPDLVAPGSHVAAASKGSYPTLDPTAYKSSFGGTSAATPAVSACAALVREYFMEGYWPSGAKNSADAMSSPSSALVKAVLINGAVRPTGDLQTVVKNRFATVQSWKDVGYTWPNPYQGWGRVDLERSLYFTDDDWKILVWDDPTRLVDGASWTATFYVGDGTTDVKVTLVWTDEPSSVEYRKNRNWLNIVNDLDLKVTDPTGKSKSYFLGNNFVDTANPHSAMGPGTPNDVDNVEGVHLVPGYSYPGDLPTGNYKITVLAKTGSAALSWAQRSNFAVVVGGEHIGPLQAQQQVGTVAVMGDYKSRITDMLTAFGYTVQKYGRNDYPKVTLALPQIDVTILNNVQPSAAGLTNLMNTANTLSPVKQKGILFLGLNPTVQSGINALSTAVTPADPSGFGNSVAPANTLVQVGVPMPVPVPPDPIFNWLPASPSFPILLGDKNGRDYQTYVGYSAATGGVSPGLNANALGAAFMIGRKAILPNGARHVVMGGFGATAACNTRHWITNPRSNTLQIFVNALEWSRGMPSPAVTPATRVGVMGDYNGQLGGFLVGKGYTVTQYLDGDFSGLNADLTASPPKLDVLILNRVTLDSAQKVADFGAMLSATNAFASTNPYDCCGVVFLSTRTRSNTGLGNLSSATGDPAATAEAFNNGVVRFDVVASHPVLNGFAVGNPVTVINGGKKDYATFSLNATPPNQSQYTLLGQSKMSPGLTGMIAVRNRTQPPIQGATKTRHVLLSPLGVTTTTAMGDWTSNAEIVLVNAVEWSKRGAP